MQIIKKKEKLGNLLFYLGIILELFIMIVNHSQFYLPLQGRIAHIAFVLFGCKILMTEYSKKEWVVIVLLGILSTVSYLTCKDEYFIRAVVMVIAAKEIDLKKIAKTIFFVSLVGTLVIIMLSLMGLMGTVVDIRHYGRGVEEARYCLGFSHANNVHSMLWYLLSMFLFLENKKCDWRHYTAFSLVNIVLYILTKSRTGIITVQILIVGSAIVRYVPDLCKKVFLYITTIFGLVCCMGVTLLGGLRGRFTPFSEMLDDLFTGRLEMVWEYAPVSKWKLFPGSTGLQYVDNGFASLFYSYGIVLGIAYLTLLAYMIYCMYKARNGVAIVFLATTIFTTLMEASFIFNQSLLCNPVFFLLFNEWYQPNKVKTEEVRA